MLLQMYLLWQVFVFQKKKKETVVNARAQYYECRTSLWEISVELSELECFEERRVFFYVVLRFYFEVIRWLMGNLCVK